jgi:hypothetical protein
MIHKCVGAYVCIYIYVCVCMYVYINVHVCVKSSTYRVLTYRMLDS